MALIYLAGKISSYCWRHNVVGGLTEHCVNGDISSVQEWPVLRHSIFGEHDYAGPYFYQGSGHGENHGANQHGARRWWDKNDRTLSQKIHDLCLDAIKRSDTVFAWIDSITCFGTIYELGLARSLEKRIWIASPRYEKAVVEYGVDDAPTCIPDLWLCFESAQSHIADFESPEDALRQFLYPPIEPSDPLTNGYVYFIEALGIGHIKIGWSVNPTKRLAQLQTGSSARLQLLGFIPGKRAFEQKLHADFSHLRHHDEWFHGTEELRSYIKSQCEEIK